MTIWVWIAIVSTPFFAAYYFDNWMDRRKQRKMHD